MRAVLLSTLVVFCSSCEGSHNDLGQDTSSSTTGGGGSGASGAGGEGAGDGGSPPAVEPDGPPILTVANGIVDRDVMALCLLHYPRNDGDDAEPWPAGGLGYARAAVIDPIPEGEIEIAILTGDLDEAEGGSCRDLVDDPASVPGVEVLSLGVVPEGTFAAPRSLLLAVAGCFGGEGHETGGVESICGFGYTPETPTPSVVFAPLSRFPLESAIGLQGVNAVSSRHTLDVFVRPSFDGVPEKTIATSVAHGAAAPFPPNFSLTASELGSPVSSIVRFAVPGVMNSTVEVSIGDASENGGIDSAAFANGNNVVFIAVGPAPGTQSGAWWNDFTVIAIEASP